MKPEEFSFYGEELIVLLQEFSGKGASLRFQARGGSMTPFIRHGDIITITPLTCSLRTGDVVAFINPANNKLAVHRIIDTGKKFFIIKGDAFSRPDGVISEDNILGCVRKVERNGKSISLGLGSERIIISWFSRLGILKPLVYLFRILIPSFIRRLIL
ncbi:MAG: signal peptidase I [Candidatus Eremiobacterota bacterium]